MVWCGHIHDGNTHDFWCHSSAVPTAQHENNITPLHMDARRGSNMCVSAQITPLQGDRTRAVGRSEACTLLSAGACALSSIISNLQLNASEKLSVQENPNHMSMEAHRACTPLFVPVYGQQDGFWSGIACVGCSHVFFETETAASVYRFTPSLQPLLQVRPNLWDVHEACQRKVGSVQSTTCTQVMAKRVASADPTAAYACRQFDQVIDHCTKRSVPGSGALKQVGNGGVMGTTIAASRHAVYDLQVCICHDFPV